jgi:hypothetical protein
MTELKNRKIERSYQASYALMDISKACTRIVQAGRVQSQKGDRQGAE